MCCTIDLNYSISMVVPNDVVYQESPLSRIPLTHSAFFELLFGGPVRKGHKSE